MLTSAPSMPSSLRVMRSTGPSVSPAPILTLPSQPMPSPPALRVTSPESRRRAVSALRLSLTAVTESVSSEIVRLASPNSSEDAPDLTPFLPFAVISSAPVPQRVSRAPSLALITAFSAEVLAGSVSSLLLSVSARVLTEPSAARIVTSEPLLQQMAAVPSAVRCRPSSTRVTPSVCFLTVTEPLAQVPLRV